MELRLLIRSDTLGPVRLSKVLWPAAPTAALGAASCTNGAYRVKLSWRACFVGRLWLKGIVATRRPLRSQQLKPEKEDLAGAELKEDPFE